MWSPACTGVVHHCLSITKWGNRISQEWFDLESPNFTLKSTLVWSVYDIVSYFWSTVIEDPNKKFRKRRIESYSENNLFNMEPSNFTQTPTLTSFTIWPDMTSSATSGQHFLKSKKRSIVPPPTVLLMVRRFACPHQLVDFLLFLATDSQGVIHTRS